MYVFVTNQVKIKLQTEEIKKKPNKPTKPSLFSFSNSKFQAKRLDRHFHHQCSHLDKGLVLHGAMCQESHCWQQETAGALDPWTAATYSDCDTFRCARCR